VTSVVRDEQLRLVMTELFVVTVRTKVPVRVHVHCISSEPFFYQSNSHKQFLERISHYEHIKCTYFLQLLLLLSSPFSSVVIFIASRLG
jgi:hypothetical protein